MPERTKNRKLGESRYKPAKGAKEIKGPARREAPREVSGPPGRTQIPGPHEVPRKKYKHGGLVSRPMKNYGKVPTHKTDTRAGVPTDSGKRKKKGK